MCCKRFIGGNCLWRIKRREQEEAERALCLDSRLDSCGRRAGRKADWVGRASDCSGVLKRLGQADGVSLSQSSLLEESHIVQGQAGTSTLCSVSGREQPWGSLALQQRWQWVQRCGGEDPSAGTQLCFLQPVLLKEFWTELSVAAPPAPHRSTSCRIREQLHDFRVPLLRSWIRSSVSPVTEGPQLVFVLSVFHHPF